MTSLQVANCANSEQLTVDLFVVKCVFFYILFFSLFHLISTVHVFVSLLSSFRTTCTCLREKGLLLRESVVLCHHTGSTENAENMNANNIKPQNGQERLLQ